MYPNEYYLDHRLVRQDYDERLRHAAAEHRARTVERLGRRQPLVAGLVEA